MMKKFFVLLPALVMMLASCSSQPDPEQMAGLMVAKARIALKHNQFAEARDSILSMRRQYPTALQARAEAILLLDSVELAQARQELAPIGPALESERATLKELQQSPHYKLNQAYYEQNRKVFAMEQRYDSIATKVKFYEKKIAVDKKK